MQARIPEQLDAELRNRASRLGLPVSTLVRNVLLHTFDLVEGIVTDGAQIARAMRGPEGLPEAPSRSAETDGPVLGWQQITLNVNAVCDQCNALLAKGAPAGIGAPVRARPVFLCFACLSALGSPSR